jgi:excisionase family DNA binding protein
MGSESNRLDAAVRYFSLADAASHISVNPATVRRWISQGHIRCYRAGRLLRVRASELHAYLARDGSREADASQVDIDTMVKRLLAREASRCRQCDHLPKCHRDGGPCSVRRCACTRLRPPVRKEPRQ